MLAPLIAAIVYGVGRRYRRIGQRIQQSISAVTGTLDEIVNGQREVKIYGGQDYEREPLRDGRERAIRQLNLKIAGDQRAGDRRSCRSWPQPARSRA